MEPDTTDDATPAAAPRGLRAAPTFTGLAGMFSAQVALSSLVAFRRALDPPRDLNTAWAHAMVRAAQEQRQVAVARELAALILAVLLFVSSTRVILRAPGAGWLWRQALLAQLALAGFTVWAERALEPARRRAFFDAARASVGPVQPLAGTASLEETLRALLAFSAAMPMLWGAVVALLTAYAFRARVRAFTG